MATRLASWLSENGNRVYAIIFILNCTLFFLCLIIFFYCNPSLTSSFHDPFNLVHPGNIFIGDQETNLDLNMISYMGIVVCLPFPCIMANFFASPVAVECIPVFVVLLQWSSVITWVRVIRFWLQQNNKRNMGYTLNSHIMPHIWLSRVNYAPCILEKMAMVSRGVIQQSVCLVRCYSTKPVPLQRSSRFQHLRKMT